MHLHTERTEVKYNNRNMWLCGEWMEMSVRSLPCVSPHAEILLTHEWILMQMLREDPFICIHYTRTCGVLFFFHSVIMDSTRCAHSLTLVSSSSQEWTKKTLVAPPPPNITFPLVMLRIRWHAGTGGPSTVKHYPNTADWKAIRVYISLHNLWLGGFRCLQCVTQVQNATPSK